MAHSKDDGDKTHELAEKQCTVLVDSEVGPARETRQSALDFNHDFEQARRTAFPRVSESCALNLKEPETITRRISKRVELHLESLCTRMIQRTSENTFQHLVVGELKTGRILAVEELELHDPTSKWRARKATDKAYADVFLPEQALLVELKIATLEAILKGVCGEKKHGYSQQAAFDKLDAVLQTMDLTPSLSRSAAHVWKDDESCPDKFFTPDQFGQLKWKDLRIPVHDCKESYLTLDSLWHEAHEQNADYWKVIGVGRTPGRDSVYVADTRVQWRKLPGNETRSGYRSVMLLVGGRRVVHDTERVDGMRIGYSRCSHAL
ncbi:hypothetical protein BDZ89DRAFT_1064170 [Hymenopellis radicata]|nr:hypothetical protein BDZ89DRAFT_1064170 [Hymenopellis radicata]